MTKGILMCVLLCGMPLFCAFIVAMQMPGKLLGMVIGMYLAPCFWSLGDTILNAVVMAKASGYITNWGGIEAITAQAKPIVETQALEMVNMVSSMYGIIPTMSLGFATLSAYALSSITGSSIGAATAGASSASAEMGSGNVSYGNVSHDNYNANKMDTYRMLNTGQGFQYQNKNVIDVSSRIVSTNEGTFDKSIIERATSKGSIVSTSVGGQPKESVETLTKGAEIGGKTWGIGTVIRNIGGGYSEVSGIAQGHGNSKMILDEKGESVTFNSASGSESKYGEKISANIGTLHYSNKDGSGTITGAEVFHIGSGADTRTIVSGTENGQAVSMVFANAQLKSVMTQTGVSSDIDSLSQFNEKDKNQHLQLIGGSIASEHREAGESGDFKFNALTLNGETFKNGSIKQTANGALITGYKDNKLYTLSVDRLQTEHLGGNNYNALARVNSSSFKSVDEGRESRPVLTLNRMNLGLTNATITKNGDQSIIEGQNADGGFYTAKVHNLIGDNKGNWTGRIAESSERGNVESKVIGLEDGNSIITAANGEWRHTGDGYSVYSGAVTWSDANGKIRKGSGTVTLQDGKLIKADATDGYNLLKAENKRSEYSTTDTVDESRKDVGILPQALAGDRSESLSRLKDAYDNWQKARGVEGELEALEQREVAAYHHYAHYDLLHKQELDNGSITPEDYLANKRALWVERSQLSQKLIPAMKEQVAALQNSPDYAEHLERVAKAEKVFDRELQAASVGTSNDFSSILGQTYSSFNGIEKSRTEQYGVNLGLDLVAGGNIVSSVTRTIKNAATEKSVTGRGTGQGGLNIGFSYSYTVQTAKRNGQQENITINGMTDYNKFMYLTALKAGATTEQLGALLREEYEAVDGTLSKIKSDVNKK
jgi:hypothetical protein